MTDLDWMGPEPDDRNLSKKCSHPKSHREPEYGVGSLGERVLLGQRCRCGHLVTLEKIRRGASNRRTGNDRERKLAARSPGGRRVGHYNGPIDVIEGMFVTQSKNGPSSFSERYWGWLNALPRTGGMIPRLVLTDGRRSMTVYVTSDDESLHGKEEVA